MIIKLKKIYILSVLISLMTAGIGPSVSALSPVMHLSAFEDEKKKKAVLKKKKQAKKHKKYIKNQRIRQHEKAYDAQRRGAIQPYKNIKRTIERQVQGKIVGQNLFQTSQGWRYQLVVRQPQGRVSHVIVDARTGQIIARK